MECKRSCTPATQAALDRSGLRRTSCIRGQRVDGRGTPPRQSEGHGCVLTVSPAHPTRNRAISPSPDRWIAPVPVAIGWDEGGRGVICQSSSEIAGSPRNLSQEDSHEAPERDSTGSDRSRTASGAPVGGRVLGAKVQDPTGKNPSRWGRFLSVGSVMARRPSVRPRRGRDRRGVGLEAAIPEGLRNSTAVWTGSIVSTRI